MKNILIFKSGENRYAIDLPSVKSIHGISDIMSEKATGDLLSGLMNEGLMHPVIDFNAFVKSEILGTSLTHGKVLLLDIYPNLLALRVDQIDRVIWVLEEQILPMPTVFKGKALSCFPAVLKQEDELFLILDPNMIGLIANKYEEISEFLKKHNPDFELEEIQDTDTNLESDAELSIAEMNIEDTIPLEEIEDAAAEISPFSMQIQKDEESEEEIIVPEEEIASDDEIIIPEMNVDDLTVHSYSEELLPEIQPEDEIIFSESKENEVTDQMLSDELLSEIQSEEEIIIPEMDVDELNNQETLEEWVHEIISDNENNISELPDDENIKEQSSDDVILLPDADYADTGDVFNETEQIEKNSEPELYESEDGFQLHESEFTIVPELEITEPEQEDIIQLTENEIIIFEQDQHDLEQELILENKEQQNTEYSGREILENEIPIDDIIILQEEPVAFDTEAEISTEDEDVIALTEDMLIEISDEDDAMKSSEIS